MKFDLAVNRDYTVAFNCDKDVEHLLELWYCNTFSCDEFLDIKEFKEFCKDTIGGEHFNEASKILKQLKAKGEQLVKQGYTVYFEDFIQINTSN